MSERTPSGSLYKFKHRLLQLITGLGPSLSPYARRLTRLKKRSHETIRLNLGYEALLLKLVSDVLAVD